MNSIFKYISNVPKKRVALIGIDKVYTYKIFDQIYYKNKQTIDKLKNNCVVIKSKNTIEFILLLSLLDGNVKRLLLLPEDIDDELIEKYYKDINVNFEVSIVDGNVMVKKINSEFIKEEIRNTEWILSTSGTTNKPKLIKHTFQSLTRTTKKDIEKGEKYIWGLCFDISRFSGIQVFLQVIAGGSSLIISSPVFSISKVLHFFVKNNCNVISATPSFWRKILMTKESNYLCLRRATLGGEIADKVILKSLSSKYKGLKLVHIYASTEVGVGFSVSDGIEGFPYRYIKEGVNNIKLKIDDNFLLWIKPYNKKCDGFLKKTIYDKDGYINTGDLVAIKDNRVYFLGRESGTINVGGNKVIPEEIEKILISTGLIKEVHVYSKRSPILGSLVCAKIVPNNLDRDLIQFKKEILISCKEKMEAFKIPAILKIVEEIEINKNGKIKRKTQ